MRRRKLIQALAGAALTGSFLPTFAQANSRIDVVKMLSFHCSLSRASEAFDPAIAQAAAATGGRLVWAPLPAHPDNTTGVPEMAYYASREVGAAFSQRVKEALFKGAQDAGLILFDPVQTRTWLESEMPNEAENIHKTMTLALGDAGRRALQRAIVLASAAGTQALPNYVLLKNSEVIESYDPQHPKTPTLSALREVVLRRIKELSQ
jgi:hypothetical protein